MQLTEVEVLRLGLDRSNNSYVVILREKNGERLLPIWIGQPEAESIVIEMSKLRRDRPLTHDLCKTLITGLGGSLRRIHITKVENRTYYAELQIHRDDQVSNLDARRLLFLEGRHFRLARLDTDGPTINLLLIAHVLADGKEHENFERSVRFEVEK